VKTFLLRLLLTLVVILGIALTTTSAECSTEKSDPLESTAKPSAEFKGKPLPGTRGTDTMLLEKFENMRSMRGEEYKPRTKHLQPDGWAKYTNRLFLESSPYLLQHAHNPVNWYPWGDEAFETAKQLNCPVLLSVGYSTCHWCHVMEEESFEDEEIAQYLNENYIAVKVDREERPDIDAIYMSAVQEITGRGGWPMTVWLTPDRKPFYGGTYFPARDGDRGAGVGFLTLLKKIKEAYDTRPDIVSSTSKQITQAIQQTLSPSSGNGLPTENVFHHAAKYYKDRFDPVYGGISGAPKFPSSFPVRLLLRYYRRTGKEEILNMAKLTLDKMASGGIYDQVGGGFHRYSVDEGWLVPHFEKMLYDNALLIMAYLEGYQVTGDENFKQIVNETLHYIKRDMSSSEGAFYSATDADSLTPGGHQDEGYFFTWTPEELEKVLDKEKLRILTAYFSVSPNGNFEGRNILSTPKSAPEIAENLQISREQFAAHLNESKELLYQIRNLRPAPLRDEKIITSWNGLMISAHAQAGLILGESEYIDRAVEAARFILENLFIGNRLSRTYKDNAARHNAYLDDYAFFIAALLDLYEATHDVKWMEIAIELDVILEKHYEDTENGGFFMTSNDHEKLIAREKPGYDGALPSGNSIAILNLLRLGEFTTQSSYRKRAEKALRFFSGILTSNPFALSEMLLTFDFFTDSPKEIVIVSPGGKTSEVESFLSVFRKQYLPNRILSVVIQGNDLKSHAKVIPLIQGKTPQTGKTTAYICESGVCKLPTTEPEVFARQIKTVEKLAKVSEIQ
jgi:uncharacterized protein YyaL (SSP411 family)